MTLSIPILYGREGAIFMISTVRIRIRRKIHFERKRVNIVSKAQHSMNLDFGIAIYPACQDLGSGVQQSSFRLDVTLIILILAS